MNRVSLLTIHDIFNYGSVLQAYASLKVLNRNNFSPEIIDYRYPNELHRKMNESKVSQLKNSLLRNTNAFCKNLLPGRQYDSYTSNYQSAKSEWYRLSERKYNSRESLLNNPPSSPIYIVGSDQVWHPRTASLDPSFFLDFAPEGSKKISYASSFGATKIDSQLHSLYRKGLLKIDHISVREKSGVDIVKKLTGKSATVVLDPTLMLNKEQWLREAILPSNSEPYILLYGSNNQSNYMEKLGLYLAKAYGCKVIRINGKFYHAFNYKMNYVLDAGPREWLGYFASAKLIIAQSFHGTAFAVNMGKPCISLLRGDEDHDSRQINFLERFSPKTTRLVAGDPFPTPYEVNLEPNYSVTNQLLDEERLMSYDFLDKALN